jgi:hypothetical protein
VWIAFRQKRWADPLLLLIAAWLASLLVAPGLHYPVSDVHDRWRVAHWLWSGYMPPKLAEDAPQPSDPLILRFPQGLPGRDGNTYPWYGVGQSLVMVPADILVTRALAWRLLRSSPQAHFLAVVYLTFPIVNAIAVVIAFSLLRSLHFAPAQAAAGALALLFGTTFLWNSQNNQENNLQLLLTLAAMAAVLRWNRTERHRELVLAGGLVGFNLLIRLTAMADVLGVALFALLLSPRQRRLGCMWDLVKYFAPVIAVGLLLDRGYHYWRFGTVWSTYITMFGVEARKLNATLSPAFPFDGVWWHGVLGPLVSPGKSIFIYDPLIVITIAIFWACRRQLTREVKAFMASLSVILMLIIAAYATYYNWEGSSCWGNRFTTTPVHAAALLAVPLSRRLRGKWFAIAVTVLILSVAIQVSSLAFPSFYEEVENGGEGRIKPLPGCRPPGEYFVLGERIKNLEVFATHSQSRPLTCEGQPMGGPLVMLVPLMPFATLSPGKTMLIKGAWTFAFATLLGVLLLLRYVAGNGWQQDDCETTGPPNEVRGPRNQDG